VRRFLTALFGITLCSGFGALAQEPPDPAPSTPVDMVALPNFEPTREEATLEAFVDGVVAAHMRDHKTPAVAVSIVQNGKEIFAKAYGEADYAAHRPANGDSTLFRIGSISKTFTWTAVMMLEERGLIDLDANVNTYLKGVTIPEAFGAPVTMNDLMAHRAGFEDTYGVFKYADESGASLTEALNATMPKRVYPPGARTSYSNWGAGLAAKIVEDVSGVPYEQFLKEEILQPLGMSRTTLNGPKVMDATQQSHLAIGYKSRAGVFTPEAPMEIGPFAPVGAISSTASDMAKYMIMHLQAGAYEDGQLMRVDTHDRMWTRAFNDRPDGADVAHGFIDRPYRGVDVLRHGGATTSYYAEMALAPTENFGVFVAQSATNDRALVIELPDLILDEMLGARFKTAGDDPAFSERAEKFAGTYLGNRRSFSRFEKIYAINDVATVSPAEGGALTLVRNQEASHYAPVPGAADTFENRYGERIVFGRNAKGAITHYADASGAHSFERVGLLDTPSTFSIAFGVALLFAITTLATAWRGALGGPLNMARLGAAAGVILFAGSFLWMIFDLSDAGPSLFMSYPPASVMAVRVIGHLDFLAGIALVAGLWPVWRGADWGLVRKAHYTVFALSLVVFAVMMAIWNVVFTATV